MTTTTTTTAAATNTTSTVLPLSLLPPPLQRYGSDPPRRSEHLVSMTSSLSVSRSTRSKPEVQLILMFRSERHERARYYVKVLWFESSKFKPISALVCNYPVITVLTPEDSITLQYLEIASSHSTCAIGLIEGGCSCLVGEAIMEVHAVAK